MKLFEWTRISLRRIDSNQRRSDSESDKRISNLNKLIEVSGGIYFGKSIDEQMKILNSKDESIKDHLLTLRFRAKNISINF